MKKISFVLLLSLFSTIIISGCTQNETDLGPGEPGEGKSPDDIQLTTLEEIRLGCIAMCQEQLNAGADLSKGPCLVNNIGENPKGEIWVCDVAHSPRQDVDNQPENQCEDYGSGVAKHFVEVDEQCNVIEAI